MKKAIKVLIKVLIGIPVVLVLLITLITVIGAIANYICNLSLRHYIKTFEAVEYSSDRLVPVKDGEYYSVVTDGDVKIMHITDIHIGGGVWTYKTDRKTIYELITMLQAEKPDLVVMGGDNTYCLLAYGWNGGNTFNNKMVAKTLISVFEHEQVYFTTIFGNHDAESYDIYDRTEIGKLYENPRYEYCVFESQFTDTDADTFPSVSNQFLLIKNTDGKITKLIGLIDSNSYIDGSIGAIIEGTYDTVHDSQVQWAADVIKELSEEEGLPKGEYLKTLMFIHIPVGEYRVALDELITEKKDSEGNYTYTVNESTGDTKFISGYWGEEKVCFGGLFNTDIAPADQDKLFEVLSEEMNSVEAYFCGHDHVNNAVVSYKDTMLSYGYSVDNTAYGKDIQSAGLQRGATVITVSPDGSFSQQHKNAYLDYGCDTEAFGHVYLDRQLYPQYYRTVTE